MKTINLSLKINMFMWQHEALLSFFLEQLTLLAK